MSIDMSVFYPWPRLWPSLRWLGRHDWLKVEPLPDFGSLMMVDERLLKGPAARAHQELTSAILQSGGTLSEKDRGNFIVALYIGSKCFGIGPKLFSPDLETCVALEQVDLNFPWGEFRLPYPSLVVRYPVTWAGRMRDAYGLGMLPVAAMIGQVCPDQIHLWVRFEGGGELHGTLTNRPGYQTVEEIIDAHEERGRRKAATAGAAPVSSGEQVLKRVTINLAVLLSHCGTKELGWVDPEQRQRHERKRGGKGKALAHGDLVRVGPADPIKVFAVTRDRGGAAEPAGSNNGHRPHWRRGHWRMQPYGEGRLLRRQVFIAPVFVCGNGEDIDPSQFPVRYEEERP